MKQNEIKVGGIYIAKVSNKLTRVRVDEIRTYNPTFGKYAYTTSLFKKEQLRYDVTNLTTGRKTTFRSAAKFRGEVQEKKDNRSDFRILADQIMNPTYTVD